MLARQANALLSCRKRKVDNATAAVRRCRKAAGLRRGDSRAAYFYLYREVCYEIHRKDIQTNSPLRSYIRPLNCFIHPLFFAQGKKLQLSYTDGVKCRQSLQNSAGK